MSGVVCWLYSIISPLKSTTYFWYQVLCDHFLYAIVKKFSIFVKHHCISISNHKKMKKIIISEFAIFNAEIYIKIGLIRRQSGQTHMKTYTTGETQTCNHAFRRYLLYHLSTGPYWTCRLSCYMDEYFK